MKYTIINNQLHIDGEPQYREGKYLCGTPYKYPIETTEVLCELATKIEGDPYPLTITKFNYNGFGVEISNELTGYRARFLSWTNDPGIAKCECSDGQTRYIPDCSMDIPFILPKQDRTNCVLFGEASSS